MEDQKETPDFKIEEYLELKKQYVALEKKLSKAEEIIKDPSRRGYYALCKTLYQQIEYLESFNIVDQIGQTDKVYDRAKGIWEGLKTMIMDCRILKQELKITAEEEQKEMQKIYRTTPEAIADAIGNKAGQLT